MRANSPIPYLAEGLHEVEGRGVVVIERVAAHTPVEVVGGVGALAAEVVQLEVVRVVVS